MISVNDSIPDPASFADPVERASAEKALAYMGLKPGVPLTDVSIDKVFIGSCTNSRIEDLRAAAEIAKGRKVAPGVQALVVPGSGPVKARAEAEGLDKIFIEAGFEWRLPGCSMCLAMNNDRLNPGERCASTSNRNFEGRQGRGGRTHRQPGNGRRCGSHRSFRRYSQPEIRRQSWQRNLPNIRAVLSRWMPLTSILTLSFLSSFAESDAHGFWCASVQRLALPRR